MSNYLDLRSFLKKFIKKSLWSLYTSGDVFFFNDVIKRKEAFLTFIDSFYGDSFGIQLFNNRDGFNYVHDLFTTSSPDLMNVTECDSICAVLASKSDLSEEEIAFIKAHGARVTDENNLLIYRFKRGYDMLLANDKEIKEIYKYVELLDSVIRNDKKLIDAAFKLEYCTYVDVNFNKCEYNLIPRPLPFLERKIRPTKANEALAMEFKDLDYKTDEAYLYTSYLPFSIEGSFIRPMLVYIIYPNELKHHFAYIIDEPKGYTEKLWTIIYDCFSELGKPGILNISDRIIYGILHKTLSLMGVDNNCDRNKAMSYDAIPNVLARFYDEELIEKRIDLDNANELLMAFKDTINALNLEDVDSSEDEYSISEEEDSDLVS